MGISLNPVKSWTLSETSVVMLTSCTRSCTSCWMQQGFFAYFLLMMLRLDGEVCANRVKSKFLPRVWQVDAFLVNRVAPSMYFQMACKVCSYQEPSCATHPHFFWNRCHFQYNIGWIITKSDDVILKMTTILKELRIVQLSS